MQFYWSNLIDVNRLEFPFKIFLEIFSIQFYIFCKSMILISIKFENFINGLKVGKNRKCNLRLMKLVKHFILTQIYCPKAFNFSNQIYVDSIFLQMKWFFFWFLNEMKIKVLKQKKLYQRVVLLTSRRGHCLAAVLVNRMFDRLRGNKNFISLKAYS